MRVSQRSEWISRFSEAGSSGSRTVSVPPSCGVPSINVGDQAPSRKALSATGAFGGAAALGMGGCGGGTSEVTPIEPAATRQPGASEPPGQPGDPRARPAEAINACSALGTGDACSFTDPQGHAVSGACRGAPDGDTSKP